MSKILVVMSLLFLANCQKSQVTELKQTSEQGPAMIRGAESMPPTYLNIPDFKKCLGTKVEGSATFYCFPGTKPDSCPQASWDMLEKDPIKQSLCAK